MSFIKFLIHKLNSNKTPHEVEDFIALTGIDIKEIVVNTLVERGEEEKDAILLFHKFENEYMGKKKRTVKIILITIVMALFCTILLMKNGFFNQEKYYINDSIVNEFEKENFNE